MIIKPVEKLIVGSKDIAESNKKRICNILEIGKPDVNVLFKEVEELLKSGSIVMLKYILENKLFFEVIADYFIDEIIEVHSSLKEELKCDYINCLKESYIIRGENGIRYSWTPLVKRYESLAKR